MHFAEAVAAFETQLKANQRSRHTVSSYLRDLGMLRAWPERENHALVVDGIAPHHPAPVQGPPDHRNVRLPA